MQRWGVLLAFALMGCGGDAMTTPADDGGIVMPQPDLAPRAPACTPTTPRPAPGTLLVEYDDGAQPVVDLIAGAQSRVELVMYQLQTASVMAALEAAAQRGVHVRAILDAKQTDSTNAKPKLEAAGVEVKLSAAKFFYTHQKTLIVDAKTALIFSGNFNDFSFGSERNYAFIESDADDVASLVALFEADWNGTAPDLSCTRLIVSPENARARLLDFINSATTTLDMEILYITDTDVKNAVIAAVGRGVTVRALFNDPAFGFADATTPNALKAAGVQARRSGSLFVHAKLILVDGKTVFIGSQNLSYSGLSSNREVGVLVDAAEIDLARIQSTFEADWQQSPSF
jgi:cardiolipin synthase A/B